MRFESATFPRVTGSTQFLEGESDEKLRAIFEYLNSSDEEKGWIKESVGHTRLSDAVVHACHSSNSSVGETRAWRIEIAS